MRVPLLKLIDSIFVFFGLHSPKEIIRALFSLRKCSRGAETTKLTNTAVFAKLEKKPIYIRNHEVRVDTRN